MTSDEPYAGADANPPAAPPTTVAAEWPPAPVGVNAPGVERRGESWGDKVVSALSVSGCAAILGLIAVACLLGLLATGPPAIPYGLLILPVTIGVTYGLAQSARRLSVLELALLPNILTVVFFGAACVGLLVTNDMRVFRTAALGGVVGFGAIAITSVATHCLCRGRRESPHAP